MAQMDPNYLRAYANLRYAEDWDRSIHAGVLADILEWTAEDPDYNAIEYIADVFGNRGNGTATEAEADK